MFNKNSFLLTYLQLYSNKTAIFAKVILWTSEAKCRFFQIKQLGGTDPKEL